MTSVDPLRVVLLKISQGQIRAAGITRITDLTPLDVLNIPVFSSSRARIDLPIPGNISVYNGKAKTKKLARLGAIMEAVERHAAEPVHHQHRLIRSTERNLVRKKLNFFSPRILKKGEGVSYRRDSLMEWIHGRDLFTGNQVWLPAYAVFCPYLAPPDCLPMKYWGTSGLASSFSTLGATVSGILELIERDAQRMDLQRGHAVEVCFDLMPPAIGWCWRRFAQSGLNLRVKAIPSHTGIPVFMAASDDALTADPALISGGYGSHWDPTQAVLRAILEAAQTRATTIQGAREDMDKFHLDGRKTYRTVVRDFAYWLEKDKDPIRFSVFRNPQIKSVVGALAYLKKMLKKVGITQGAVVEFTHPEVGIPVVKILIPKLMPVLI